MGDVVGLVGPWSGWLPGSCVEATGHRLAGLSHKVAGTPGYPGYSTGLLLVSQCPGHPRAGAFPPAGEAQS